MRDSTAKEYDKINSHGLLVPHGAEATEEDHPDVVTSHGVFHQQQAIDSDNAWTGSHSNRSQSERKRRTGFANPTKSGASELARQLRNVLGCANVIVKLGARTFFLLPPDATNNFAN